MKRIFLMLTAAALMVAVLATTAAPAFAVPPEMYGKLSQEKNVDFGCPSFDDPGYHWGSCPKKNYGLQRA
jgi:hypothetical protein